MAANLVNLGSIAFDRGDLEAAGEFFEHALEIQQQLVPGSVPLATSLSNLGTVAERLGEPERAIGYYERSLAIRRQLAPGSVDVARSFMNLGFTHQVLGHPEVAASFSSVPSRSSNGWLPIAPTWQIPCTGWGPSVDSSKSRRPSRSRWGRKPPKSG